MRYTKPPLTFEQQADQLLQRGLVAERDHLIETLERVNYYRLSGYLYPFRNDDDTYKNGTTLKKVWRRYAFDRRLRLLVLDAIERIEITVRTLLVYHFSHRYGAFGHIYHQNLNKLYSTQYADWLSRLQEETDRSKETFVRHFKTKYTDHEHLPLWMACEIMSLGCLLTFFRGTEHKIKKNVAEHFSIPAKVLESWMLSLNTIRNVCAHHERLWNRGLGIKPYLPDAKNWPDWHQPIKIPNHRIFAVLTICRYMLGLIAPQSRWPRMLHDLLNEYQDIPRRSMGFPYQWEKCPIWRDDFNHEPTKEVVE